jgi:hypothetical protein
VLCPQAPAFAEGGELSLSPFGSRLHFTYQDPYLNLQDIFWGGPGFERPIALPEGFRSVLAGDG